MNATPMTASADKTEAITMIVTRRPAVKEEDKI
jgi:hypothetical protein